MSIPESVATEFLIEGNVQSINPFGSGHINQTYLVETSAATYLLQSVNLKVFVQPEIIFQNYVLLEPLVSQGLILPWIHTSSGNSYLFADGACWKVQPFVSRAFAPLRIKNQTEVFEAARGFALFNKACLGLATGAFREVIPGFHDLYLRLRQLDAAVEKGSAERKKTATHELKLVGSFGWIADQMSVLKAEGLPVRVCHNDTKAGNVLLSRQNSTFLKVIDLDTVGPGYLLYDFGDMMRTMLSPSTESVDDTSRIAVNTGFFRQLVKGYLSVLASGIDMREKRSLVFGGLYMTYIMAVRFLTDYLLGDIYYKTGFDHENLIRARNQLALLEKMHDLQPGLESIVEQHV